MKNTFKENQTEKSFMSSPQAKFPRKLAWGSIFFTLIFMIIAIFQYQDLDEPSAHLPADPVELFFNEHWLMTSLNSSMISKSDVSNEDKLLKQIDENFSSGNFQEVTLPYTGKSAAGEIIVFKNTLPELYAGLTLEFSSTNTNVRVILDGAILYQYGLGTSKSYGTHENLINIPNVFENGEIWIELTSPFPDTAMLGNIKLETRDMVLIGLVGNNIVDIGCCLLIIIMAIILFMLALIRKYTQQQVRAELFLGLFALTAGIYCFIETGTLNIFYDIDEAYVMQEYFMLLLPLFLARYFEQNLNKTYPLRFLVLLFCTSINALAQILLQILGIQNLKDMTLLSSALMCVVCIVANISLMQFRNKKRLELLFPILSVFALLAGELTDIIANICFEDGYGNISTQYNITVFCIMMAAIHTLQLSKEYRTNAEKNARLLQEKVTIAEQQNIQLIQAKKEADAARQEAQTANEAKGKFLAQMSHEIRTPINAVLGMDEMILRESNEQPIKEYAMDIYMAGQTLLSLINDILDLSKIDSGKMEMIPIEYDFSSLIHDLTNMTSQRARAKNIHLEVEIDPEIPCQLYGDDVRIRQILTNLLTNAVKYTQEGTIWLRVKSCKMGEMVLLNFEVEDTGIGIKEEDLPKLFAEFERIEENRNRNIEGTGLGMSITIQLLSLLGSKLHVESTYQKGSKFWFDLQQKIIDPAPIGDFKSRIQQIAQDYHYHTAFCAPDANILVVDDNATNRKVFCNLLKKTQIQITEAGSGAECLNLIQKNHYDLIFLDHMMPDLDGIETLHCMRELSDYPCQETPIIVLTANAVSGAKEHYLSEGFDDFLSKPIVPEKLEHMIQRMLPQPLLQEFGTETTAHIPSANLTELDTASASLESLPQVDGLDWRYAWQHLQDMELLAYTIKQFYAQIESAADTLEQAYTQIDMLGQFDPYRIQVHAMKGLSATAGILPLYGIAQILESAAREQKRDVILSMTPVFLNEWRSYRQKLQGVFGIENTTKKEAADLSVIQALVEMIRFSMHEMDIDQADELINQLQTYQYSDAVTYNIQKLAESVTNLDPEETDRFASLIMKQLEP